MNTKLYSFLFLLCLLISCSAKEDTIDSGDNSGSISCDDFVSALLELDLTLLESMLNPELEKLTLLDQDNNACLHDNNLMALTDMLSASCDKLNASVICCGCIETLPTISEVSIHVDSFGVKVVRVLDLLTSDEQGVPLRLRGVHL